MEKIKILVVDDNEEFCENMKDILEVKDYEVEVVYDGFSAIEIVKQKKFDIILLDIKMPIMNGLETYKKIKKITPDTKVFMITAYAVEDLIKEALKEGAFGVLRKPIDFNKLFDLIEKSLKSSGLIFIVDDDENLCENLKEILTHHNYVVTVAHNGVDAIEKVKEENFDIILLDMKLPILNGFEVFCSIKELRPNVTVIIITGYINDLRKQIDLMLTKKAYICLEKPINIDYLLNLIKEITNTTFCT